MAKDKKIGNNSDGHQRRRQQQVQQREQQREQNPWKKGLEEAKVEADGHPNNNNRDDDDRSQQQVKIRKVKKQLQQSQKQLLELSSVIYSLSGLPIEYEKVVPTKSQHDEDDKTSTTGTTVTNSHEVSINNLKRKIETVIREFERLKEENNTKDIIIQKLREKLQQQQQQKAATPKEQPGQRDTCGCHYSSRHTGKNKGTMLMQTPPMTPTTTTTSTSTSTSPSTPSSYYDSVNSYTLSSPSSKSASDDSMISMISTSNSVVNDGNDNIELNRETTTAQEKETHLNSKFENAIETIKMQNFKIERLEREVARLAAITATANTAKTQTGRKIDLGSSRKKKTIVSTDKKNNYDDIDLIDAMHTKNLQNETTATKW